MTPYTHKVTGRRVVGKFEMEAASEADAEFLTLLHRVIAEQGCLSARPRRELYAWLRAEMFDPKEFPPAKGHKAEPRQRIDVPSEGELIAYTDSLVEYAGQRLPDGYTICLYIDNEAVGISVYRDDDVDDEDYGEIDFEVDREGVLSEITQAVLAAVEDAERCQNPQEDGEN